MPIAPYFYSDTGVGSTATGQNGIQQANLGGNDPLVAPYLIVDPGMADEWMPSTVATARTGMRAIQARHAGRGRECKDKHQQCAV